MNIAMTTLSSKILSQDKEYFAGLAVDAVLRLKVLKLLMLYTIYLQLVVLNFWFVTVSTYSAAILP